MTRFSTHVWRYCVWFAAEFAVIFGKMLDGWWVLGRLVTEVRLFCYVKGSIENSY